MTGDVAKRLDTAILLLPIVPTIIRRLVATLPFFFLLMTSGSPIEISAEPLVPRTIPGSRVAGEFTSDLVDEFASSSGGEGVQQLLLELAARKEEALPEVRRKLMTGSPWEQHMMTKLLRYVAWEETVPELLMVANDRSRHWLARSGALYALGSIGNRESAEQIAPLLGRKDENEAVVLAAISAVSRLQHERAADQLKVLQNRGSIHEQLFASRALSGWGIPVNESAILELTKSTDPVIRGEACDALAMSSSPEARVRLELLARSDSSESVRACAAIATIRHELATAKAGKEITVLTGAVESADRLTDLWIVQALSDRRDQASMEALRSIAERPDFIGDRARADLSRKGVALEFSALGPDSTSEDKHSGSVHQLLIRRSIEVARANAETEIPAGDPEEEIKKGALSEDEFPTPMAHGYNPVCECGFLYDLQTAADRCAELDLSFASALTLGNYATDGVIGAWEYEGRISHLLEDMSSPLHSLAIQHVEPMCGFETYWAARPTAAAELVSEPGKPLDVLDPLPEEANEYLDAFSQSRLNWRVDNGCNLRTATSPMGFLQVLAYITYFRSTYWGEVKFGTSGSTGMATSSTTTETTFSDGVVRPQPNTLHLMFDGKVRWIDGWFDNYYEITDRTGAVYRWMSWSDFDAWSACGRTGTAGGWTPGYLDSSKRIGGSDDDDPGVRITGRFWFDTRELSSSRSLYPSRYPNGNMMTESLLDYYGRILLPLAVRYNAGLLRNMNRRISVDAVGGIAEAVECSRRDNWDSPHLFDATSVATQLCNLFEAYLNLLCQWHEGGLPRSQPDTW